MATKLRQPTASAPAGSKPPATGLPLPSAKRSRWWLRRPDQAVLAGLTLAALVLIAAYWLDMSGWGRQPIEIDRLPEHAFDFRLDPNQANWVEWAQLPGLGEILAKRIVEDRERNGAFRTVDELLRVNGIGPKKLEAIRPFLTTPSSPPSDHAPAEVPFTELPAKR